MPKRAQLAGATLDTLQVHEMRAVLDDVLEAVIPLVEMERLVARADAPGASAFERYAGIVLRDAGVEEVAQAPFAASVIAVPPRDMHLVRLETDRELSDGEWAALERVENAFNRLLCIADAIEDGIDGLPHSSDVNFFISRQGSGFEPKRPGFRSAYVALPALELGESATPAYFNEVDWRVFDHTVANGHVVFQNNMLPNPNLSSMGAHAAVGSDWDVRTRMASILESLELPLRFSYRYDCDTQAQCVSVRFTVPDGVDLPRVGLPVELEGAASSAQEGGAAELSALEGQVGVDDRVERARLSYVVRLACLMASAVFGSGKLVARAFVSAWDASWERPLMSFEFDRFEFVQTTLKAIDSGALCDAKLRFDYEAACELAHPVRASIADSRDSASCAEVYDDGMDAQRVEVWRDARLLDDKMQELFLAQRVCDVDAAHYLGGNENVIELAKQDANDSPMAAIAHLEFIVDELEHLAAPEEGDDRRLLFCDGPYARAVVSLAADQFDVGSEAEKYLIEDGDRVVDEAERLLRGSLPRAGRGLPLQSDVRFKRAPDALFHAHLGLSDLYERMGDYRGAEDEADKCIELAPTVARAHFRKADILAQQGRFVEAANVILGALPSAVREEDCALLYYHLALFLWRIGNERDAATVFEYLTSFEGDYARKAAQTVQDLRKRAGTDHPISASPTAAAEEMKRAGIPVAPSREAKNLLARAAIGLASAHAPLAAAPYAAALVRFEKGNPTLAIAWASLRYGRGA